MRCEDINSFVYPYLDGEFEARDCAEFEAHLEVCGPCRSRIEGERAFLEQVRGLRTETPRAPAELRERVRSSLLAAEREQRGWRRWLPGYVWKPLPVIGSLGLLAFFLWPVMGTSLDPVVAELVAKHESDATVDVAGPEPQRLQRYYSTRLSFPVRLPRFPGHYSSVLGGHVVRMGDRPSARAVYDVDGEKLTVVAFEGDDELTGAERGWILREAAGYNVALYRHAGVTYGVTSRLGRPQLEHIVHQASFAP